MAQPVGKFGDGLWDGLDLVFGPQADFRQAHHALLKALSNWSSRVGVAEQPGQVAQALGQGLDAPGRSSFP